MASVCILLALPPLSLLVGLVLFDPFKGRCEKNAIITKGNVFLDKANKKSEHNEPSNKQTPPQTFLLSLTLFTKYTVAEIDIIDFLKDAALKRQKDFKFG